MATRIKQDELSELASFVGGLARAIARDAHRLHKAAAIIRHEQPANARPMTDAALAELRHCCRSLTDCVFRLRAAMFHVEPEPDGDATAQSGSTK